MKSRGTRRTRERSRKSARPDLSRPITLLLGDRLRHEKVTLPETRSGGAEFRFSVPVLRVRDVQATLTWYATHLGFVAGPYPQGGPPEFATLGRDGVQLLVRHAGDGDARAARVHSGWDLNIWVDGADFDRIEASAAAADAIVRPRRTMGDHIAEIEVRDPDGYVICIGGPIRTAAVKRD